LETTEITDAETSFRRLLDMPASIVGRRAVQVEISVDRTTQGPDGQPLGVVFGTISLLHK